MPDEVIIRHCSPTLAGLKTGNLFLVRYETESEIKNDIFSLNKRLVKKGIRVLPVRYGEGKALLYLYRPSHLKKDLENGEAARLLSDMGYMVTSPERCLVKLIEKFQDRTVFPHEVGLFLGYPPEDVKGFMENKASGCKYTGCWKVYGDEEKAKIAFSKYQKCTSSYKEQLKKGKSIEQLTVAV